MRDQLNLRIQIWKLVFALKLESDDGVTPEVWEQIHKRNVSERMLRATNMVRLMIIWKSNGRCLRQEGNMKNIVCAGKFSSRRPHGGSDKFLDKLEFSECQWQMWWRNTLSCYFSSECIDFVVIVLVQVILNTLRLLLKGLQMKVPLGPPAVTPKI